MPRSVSPDHDLLIEMRTDLKYIVATIGEHATDISGLKKENQARKDWQENADTKIKIYTAIATVIGGFVVWVGDIVFKLWERRG